MNIEMPGLVLFTEDYSACVRFYREVLGLPLLFARDGQSCLHFGGAYLMIESDGWAHSRGKSRNQNPTVLRFNVLDVQATAAELRDKGLTVTLQQQELGAIACFVDPDGNRCELNPHQALFTTD